MADVRDQLRNDWLARLNALIDQIETWGRELGWSTRRIEKQMRDSEIGTYVAPALLLQEDVVRLMLEPIARSAPGAEGVVDLYLMPAYDDVASLYRCDGAWQLHYRFPGTPSAATIRNADAVALSREALEDVLNEMKSHAASPV